MDYLYVRAWGYLMGSHASYIADQVAQARKDKAPEDATYKQQDGTWATMSTFAGTADRREQLEAYVAKRRDAA